MPHFACLTALLGTGPQTCFLFQISLKHSCKRTFYQHLNAETQFNLWVFFFCALFLCFLFRHAKICTWSGWFLWAFALGTCCLFYCCLLGWGWAISIGRFLAFSGCLGRSSTLSGCLGYWSYHSFWLGFCSSFWLWCCSCSWLCAS